ncbi:hypothetical protein ABFS83_07G082400 [Erythranthe nasuta]
MKKMTKLLLQSISPPFFGNNFHRHMTPIRRRRPLSLRDGVTKVTTRSKSKQTRLFSCGHRESGLFYFMHSTFDLFVIFGGHQRRWNRLWETLHFFWVMVNPLYLHPRLHHRIW